jgi:hypothetical protein
MAEDLEAQPLFYSKAKKPDRINALSDHGQSVPIITIRSRSPDQTLIGNACFHSIAQTPLL